MLAVDSFMIETISLQRLYVLFFIELGNRRVRLAGSTANPTGAWVTQQARQFAWTLQKRRPPFRFLIRDRDSKFTRDFDADLPGLVEFSAKPGRLTPAERVAVVLALRQYRMTAAEVAKTLGMPLSTVSAVLRRNGVSRLGRIGLEQPLRYERSRPGELVHIDIKKLGRIKGGASIDAAC